MWYEDLPHRDSWASLWHGYILCGNCSGIRRVDGVCPACNAPELQPTWTKVTMQDGREMEFPPAYMGAEARYEDWVYLRMLQREWTRPLAEIDLLEDIPQGSRPSPRAAIVLLFWTYFETRVDRLFRQSMKEMPGSTAEDLLRRYAVIGGRLDRLYKILFGTTYWRDLEELGHGAVAELLRRVHDGRNRFMHGEPSAIDDHLVADLVNQLKNEHEAWISAFNKRATRVAH
jgi:hypothetical protein